MTDLETATEATRELDDEVLLACGWTKKRFVGPENDEVHWRDPAGKRVGKPKPTRSVDDALMLVPEGWVMKYMEGPYPPKYKPHDFEIGDTSRVHLVTLGAWPECVVIGMAATPALALCQAIIWSQQDE